MTFTIDPAFVWQLIVMAFFTGVAWGALHLRVRWLEKQQDLRFEELKRDQKAEFERLDAAHSELKNQHTELKTKVENKGESLITLVEQLKQLEKRIDEKISLSIRIVEERFAAWEDRMSERTTGSGPAKQTTKRTRRAPAARAVLVAPA